MGNSGYGRDIYIEKIKGYAESITAVGNQAFLGVKGVGKTTLFHNYFNKKKREELADRFKKLFVFSQLDSRKRGDNLYKFLLAQVQMGIMEISNVEDKQSIKSEIDEINEIFSDSLDSKLIQYLTIIKDRGYDLVLIMDQFHCMARDTEIGQEQYDVLRSFNEQKLITYWIITDTDLIETCASKQYISSFFAQKFTSKLTIGPLSEDERDVVVEFFDNQKKSGLTEPEKRIISEVSGGIPELISILIDVLGELKNEGNDVSSDELIHAALTHNGCVSLFEGWVSGLSSNQKKILHDVALSTNGYTKDLMTISESKMAELSDEVGRGLLHVCKEDDKKVWKINIKLFEKYILLQGETFYHDVIETMDTHVHPAEAHVTNIFNIEGNYIQNQKNNILNIENAVTGLEDLQRLVNGNLSLLDQQKVMGKLDYLPFRQEVWLEMNEDEQEEELEKYANEVFSSEIFSNGLLTSEQMQYFCLSEDLLDNLSENCKTQIVCGVQVYNLIQLCIDNFGLSMSESESPRGILFARAFERHLKDVVAPAYCRIPEIAVQRVYPTMEKFIEYPIEKTTIGTYSSILGKEYRRFAQVSTQLLAYEERNEDWWKKLGVRMSRIGKLRNECCHSGKLFDNDKLTNLINRIFKQNTLEDVLIFSKIPDLSENL